MMMHYAVLRGDSVFWSLLLLLLPLMLMLMLMPLMRLARRQGVCR
jgi:hypothetical protein